MTPSTITVSYERPKPKMIEPTTEMDGFTATMKALRDIGLDMKGVPLAVARVIYSSGVAFSKSDRSTEDERMRWRNSIIWPVTDK